MALGCITGIGMVSSLGYDVVSACAASRAGVVRSKELDYFPTMSTELGGGGVEFVSGHSAGDLTIGFEGYGRLLRLTCAGLEDLARQIPAESQEVDEGFYLSLPDSNRVYRGSDLIADDALREAAVKVEAAARDTTSLAPQDPEFSQKLIARAAAIAGWAGEPKVLFASEVGQCGGTQAVRQALVDLQSGTVKRAIVGGIDSLLDEPTLAWLAKTGRLKSSSVPSGLQPGEAAAFMVLERDPPSSSIPSLASIDAIQETLEPRSILSAQPPLGEGLAAALDAVGQAAGWQGHGPAWIVTDQNGEYYRALEWGQAATRVAARWPACEDPVVWYPAASFGDTGAASALVAVCEVIRASVRGYAPAARAAICSTSDSTERSALVLSTTNGEDTRR